MDESGGTQAACQSEEGQEAKQTLGALPIRIVAFAAAGMLALAAGFGLTRLADPPRAAPLSAVIPSPAGSGGVFTENDDGIGQDSESTILRPTAWRTSCPAAPATRAPWHQPRLAEPAK